MNRIVECKLAYFYTGDYYYAGMLLCLCEHINAYNGISYKHTIKFRIICKAFLICKVENSQEDLIILAFWALGNSVLFK